MNFKRFPSQPLYSIKYFKYKVLVSSVTKRTPDTMLEKERNQGKIWTVEGNTKKQIFNC